MTFQPPPHDFALVPPPGDHLLPPNATLLERALSASDRRTLWAPTWVIRAAWDPDLCPAHLLPYLAAAWSVDEWDPTWPDDVKRAVIRDSLWLHQHKGTVGALKRSLARLRLDVSVSEWFEHNGAPYTFRLRTRLASGASWTRSQAEQMWRVALRAKNVRSWIDDITVVVPPPPETIATRVGVAIVGNLVSRPILTPPSAITAPRDYLRIGVVIKTRVLTRSAPIGD